MLLGCQKVRKCHEIPEMPQKHPASQQKVGEIAWMYKVFLVMVGGLRKTFFKVNVMLGPLFLSLVMRCHEFLQGDFTTM